MVSCISFPAISTQQSRVLILGSMPGVKSLEMGQYYAHPQNAFWKIMAALFDMPVATYPERVALIRDSGLALWDVLKYCEREGSLDSNIDPDTVEINDFAAFFKKHPQITHVFLNGGTAAAAFKKRVLPLLDKNTAARLEIHQLPSTSPAHATLGLKDKISKWKAVKEALL